MGERNYSLAQGDTSNQGLESRLLMIVGKKEDGCVDSLSRRSEEAIMNSFLSREVYIRIADDQAAFVCTVKRGILYSRTTVVPLIGQPAAGDMDGKSLMLARKRLVRKPAREPGQNPLGLEDEQAPSE